MAESFFLRLQKYYMKVAEVLRGEAESAAIFPNTTDIGMSREKIYAEFLTQHLPTKCNVLFGGFLFDDEGAESSQLDIIITTDTTPCFNFHNKDGSGKTFSHVEGTLGVVSVKTNLNQAGLNDSLSGFASIAKTKTLTNRINALFQYAKYDDWPLKIIYSTTGIHHETLLGHINEFYSLNPQIPLNRRPNFIHVAGKYFIVRGDDGMLSYNKNTEAAEPLEIGKYYVFTENSDLQAIVWILKELQVRAMTSTHILFLYTEIFTKINLIS